MCIGGDFPAVGKANNFLVFQSTIVSVAVYPCHDFTTLVIPFLLLYLTELDRVKLKSNDSLSPKHSAFLSVCPAGALVTLAFTTLSMILNLCGSSLLGVPETCFGRIESCL